MDKAKQWTPEGAETMTASVGVALGPGRAEKLAAAMNTPKAADPLREGLSFDVDATSYAAAVRRSKAP